MAPVWRYAVPDVTSRLEALVAPPTLAAARVALGALGEVGGAGVEGFLLLALVLFALAPPHFVIPRELLPPEFSDRVRDDLDAVCREDGDSLVVLGGVVGVEAGGAGAGRGDQPTFRALVRAGNFLLSGVGH